MFGKNCSSAATYTPTLVKLRVAAQPVLTTAIFQNHYGQGYLANALTIHTSGLTLAVLLSCNFVESILIFLTKSNTFFSKRQNPCNSLRGALELGWAISGQPQRLQWPWKHSREIFKPEISSNLSQ